MRWACFAGVVVAPRGCGVGHDPVVQRVDGGGDGDLDDGHLVPLLDVDRAAVEDLLVPVEVPHEARHPALEVEVLLAVDAIVDATEVPPESWDPFAGFGLSLTDVWYSWVGSNHRPPDPQSGALTN